MNVHSVKSGNTFAISVQGNLQNQTEREEFYAAFHPKKGNRYELSFFDARLLPAEVILYIKKVLSSSPDVRIRINVFHRYLGSYFYRLGIPCHVVQQHSLEHASARKIKAIAIGGSAGSLDKIMSIMSRLPLKDISIFIIQHILENEPNYLGEILRRNTKFNIAEVSDGIPVKPSNVYIAPPGLHMLIHNGRIRLTNAPKFNFARPSIQLCLDTLASEYGESLIAVLLCGYGSDGSHSFSTLKQEGAITIIEDPADCEARDLPESAWQTGLVDYKFPLPELGSYLVRMIEPEVPRIEEADLKQFLSLLHDQYGYDYRHYSSQSAIRRISRVMADQHIYSFKRFKDLILQDKDLFETLFLECSINVTEFFRNPETFQNIRDKVLPYLDSFPHIKVWSAGCSTGQEAISIAILLDELGLLQKSQIYASDINPFVVEEAQNGIYSTELIEKCRDNYQQAGGKGDFAQYFTINDGLAKFHTRLKDRILYFQHSLLNKGAFNEFHLILCRNVLIYFDQDLQSAVLDLFFRSMDMNGFLILGESETISSFPIGFEVFNKQNRIYKKII